MSEPDTLPTRSTPVLTLASLRWVLAHRAWTPWYLVRYWRFFRMRARNRGAIVTRGMVFLDHDVDISARPGHARLILGRWVHVGAHSALRAHEGTMIVGDRAIVGRHVSINGYLDVEIGANALLADHIYISDFDHRYADVNLPIKDQGIVKTRTRVEPDVWIGTRVTVTRGVVIGTGSVIGANAVVTRDVPPWSVAVGVPARVVKSRKP